MLISPLLLVLEVWDGNTELLLGCVFCDISRINLLLLADFIEVCGDKIVKECIQHKAMRDIYTKRKDERSKKSK